MSASRGGGALVVAGIALVALVHAHKVHFPAATGASLTAAHGGTLGCTGLERLWEQAGGSPGAARLAASVAMAESSGQQYARSGTGDIGYWQINASTWGSLATYDPAGNARAAVQISHDGTNWTPWVTWNTGAYLGRC